MFARMPLSLSSSNVEVMPEKNPRARIVANAIALETVGEIAEIARARGFADCEIVQLSLARGKRAGRYHLMTGLNPVTIASLQRRKGGAPDED